MSESPVAAKGGVDFETFVRAAMATGKPPKVGKAAKAPAATKAKK